MPNLLPNVNLYQPWRACDEAEQKQFLDASLACQEAFSAHINELNPNSGLTPAHLWFLGNSWKAFKAGWEAVHVRPH